MDSVEDGAAYRTQVTALFIAPHLHSIYVLRTAEVVLVFRFP
jgi:hypothetical protein